MFCTYFICVCMYVCVQARVDLVRALRNPGPWDAPTMQRLASLPGSTVVELDAGHNVHVDDLPGVLAAIDDSFA